MMSLRAKLLEVRELPALDEKFPASCLVAAVAGSKTINLVAPFELLDQLKGLEPFTELLFELAWRPIDLAELGGSGKGKAYRLRIIGLVDEEAQS